MAHLIDYIEGSFTEYEIEYRIHATQRMFQRDYEPDPAKWTDNFSRRLT